MMHTFGLILQVLMVVCVYVGICVAYIWMCVVSAGKGFSLSCVYVYVLCL